MLKDPYILGYGIGVIVVVLAGYAVMTVFVSFVSSLYAQVEAEQKRKKEEERKQRHVA